MGEDVSEGHDADDKYPIGYDDDDQRYAAHGRHDPPLIPFVFHHREEQEKRSCEKDEKKKIGREDFVHERAQAAVKYQRQSKDGQEDAEFEKVLEIVGLKDKEKVKQNNPPDGVPPYGGNDRFPAVKDRFRSRIQRADDLSCRIHPVLSRFRLEMLEECSLPLDRDIDTMSVLSHGVRCFSNGS
ncbi:MAG: hypothetical protein HGB29_04130 [Chlorobiaceae bacterium]|nr:hypothetical protein [Chlorobiaceae bacterium]NTW74031.1 hypothetical protein [Chlorobiaceae bacterium]